MKRILFVDDESKVLDGLQRMLRPQRREWEMTFANSGGEALGVLERQPIDVVVTDMRMPGMDGPALLERVCELHPGVMRIVLSGQFDDQAGGRAVPLAHIFLTKPCDPNSLKSAIERYEDSATEVFDQSTRRLVNQVGLLPSPSPICRRLMEAIKDPNGSLAAVGEIVNQDVALSAKILQLTSSAFFNMPRGVTDVRRALAFVGMETLKQMVLSVEIVKEFQPKNPVAGFSLEDFQDHSRVAAAIAGRIAARSPFQEIAPITALLHDVGKLVLASRLPQEWAEAIRLSKDQGRPLHECERGIFGTSHAEIGGYLLNVWGLPKPVVAAISAHHSLHTVPKPSSVDLLVTLHAADVLAREGRSGPQPDTGFPAGLDAGFLDQLPLETDLPQWRAFALTACSQDRDQTG